MKTHFKEQIIIYNALWLMREKLTEEAYLELIRISKWIEQQNDR